MEIPNYGDHMTMEDFCSCCKAGLFINSDGFGNYASKTEIFYDPDDGPGDVYPSMVKDGTIDKGYSHVVWFNK